MSYNFVTGLLKPEGLDYLEAKKRFGTFKRMLLKIFIVKERANGYGFRVEVCGNF
jgi:hypothetical protein